MEPNDYLSRSPFDIQALIYKHLDAFTLDFNWETASAHLPSSAYPPEPIEIWIAAMQVDQLPDDLFTLPTVITDPEYDDYDLDLLPDAAYLCRFIQSKSALQKIYDSRRSVPYGNSIDAKNAVHVAMRHNWHDMIDVFDFDLSDDDKEFFAVEGSHWEYFQYLKTLQGLKYHDNDFFDYAARNGELELLMKLPSSVSGTTDAMDWAARQGHLNVVQWLHSNGTQGCSTNAMDGATENLHFDLVKWLHFNRTEGCTVQAIFWAAEYSCIDIVKWLHTNRPECNIHLAIEKARRDGYGPVIVNNLELSLLRGENL